MLVVTLLDLFLCSLFEQHIMRGSQLFGWNLDHFAIVGHKIDTLSTGFLSAMYRQDIFSNEECREIRWGG
jgi:hypothetical protein